MFYLLYPFERNNFVPLIIEVKNAKRDDLKMQNLVFEYIKTKMCTDVDEYCDLAEFDTIEAATAIDRGCECYFIGGKFRYYERQGKCTQAYMSMPEYLNNNPKDINGTEYDKPAIITHERFQTFLEEKGIGSNVTPIKPQGFDGTKCRECGGAKYMAEPDHLKNDGMLTCYTCKERLKSFRLWPYEGIKKCQ